MDNWTTYLSSESKLIARKLIARVDDETRRGREIYPPRDQIFRALSLCSPEKTSVVIIGQDPYHQPGQANGLAFSVNPGVKIPPSLRNIFKELNSDIGCPIPKCGDLTTWAERGVLLLNTSLTVEKDAPASHVLWGWQSLVLEVCNICAEMPQPIVFLLWGAHARTFTSGLRIDERKGKLSLCSSHPSPLGARKASREAPAFLGSRPFSRTNNFLQYMGAQPIDWRLEEGGV